MTKHDAQIGYDAHFCNNIQLKDLNKHMYLINKVLSNMYLKTLPLVKRHASRTLLWSPLLHCLGIAHNHVFIKSRIVMKGNSISMTEVNCKSGKTNIIKMQLMIKYCGALCLNRKPEKVLHKTMRSPCNS